MVDKRLVSLCNDVQGDSEKQRLCTHDFKRLRAGHAAAGIRCSAQPSADPESEPKRPSLNCLCAFRASSSTILFTKTSMCLARLRKKKVLQMTQHFARCKPHHYGLGTDLHVPNTSGDYLQTADAKLRKKYKDRGLIKDQPDVRPDGESADQLTLGLHNGGATCHHATQGRTPSLHMLRSILAACTGIHSEAARKKPW